MLRMLWSMAILLLLSACNADQMEVNQIQGSWRVGWQRTLQNGVEIGRTEQDSTDSRYTFERCRVRKDLWCDAQLDLTLSGQRISQPLKYSIVSSGTMISWDMDGDLSTAGDRYSAELITSNRDAVHYQHTVQSGSDEYTYETFLERAE